MGPTESKKGRSAAAGPIGDPAASNPVDGEVRLAKIWSARPGHVIAEWNNTLFTMFRDGLSVEALEIARKASHDLHSRWPAGIVVFSIVPGAMVLPDGAARAKASSVIAETGGHILRTVTVLQGNTLWMSAARAIVATITLLSRSNHPHRVFSSIADGAAFAESDLQGPGATAAALQKAAELVLASNV